MKVHEDTGIKNIGNTKALSAVFINLRRTIILQLNIFSKIKESLEYSSLLKASFLIVKIPKSDHRLIVVIFFFIRP